MITDANNYGEWKTRRRITGMNVAANIFVIKLGVAVGGAIIGWVLAFYGYATNSDTQPDGAVDGVIMLFTLLPALFYLLTAVSIKFYQLTADKMHAVVQDLQKGQFAG